MGDKKRRWVALEVLPNLYDEDDLPYYGALEGYENDYGRLYHWGGLSSLSVYPGKHRILHDYGMFTDDEVEAEDLDARFLGDFPPHEAERPEEVILKGAAWIAPDGRMFACRYEGHRMMADRLLQSEGMRDTYKQARLAAGLRVPDDYLASLGWIKVQPDHIWATLARDLTPRQLDALFDLAQCPLTSVRWPKFVTEYHHLMQLDRDDDTRSAAESYEEQRQQAISVLNAQLQEVPAAPPEPEPEPAPEPAPCKPFFDLRAQPYVDITIRCYRARDEKSGRSVSAFTVDMCVTEVTGDAADGSEVMIGSVEGRIGGLHLRDDRRPYDHHYIAKHRDIWFAFQRALDATPGQELPEGAPVGPKEEG